VASALVLRGWSVTSSAGGRSTGAVTVAIGGDERSGEATGNGPVNALYKAVDDAIGPVFGWQPTLVDYQIRAVTEGEDAQGQVTIRVRRSIDGDPDSMVVTGHGLSTNIIEASLEAYVMGANKLYAACGSDEVCVRRPTAESLP
jgi:2-isopropylmalate synthase